MKIKLMVIMMLILSIGYARDVYVAVLDTLHYRQGESFSTTTCDQRWSGFIYLVGFSPHVITDGTEDIVVRDDNGVIRYHPILGYDWVGKFEGPNTIHIITIARWYPMPYVAAKSKGYHVVVEASLINHWSDFTIPKDWTILRRRGR